jgi:hypothetical protein
MFRLNSNEQVHSGLEIHWNINETTKNVSSSNIVQGRRGGETLVSSISGETGGLSESEPPPLRGPLLWESRPEVSGDNSCCKPSERGNQSASNSVPLSRKQACNRSRTASICLFFPVSLSLWFLSWGELERRKKNSALSCSCCPRFTPQEYSQGSRISGSGIKESQY